MLCVCFITIYKRPVNNSIVFRCSSDNYCSDDSFPAFVLSPVDWHLLCITMNFFTFSQDFISFTSRPSTGGCVFLHRATLQMSRWLYRTHCRDTPKALVLVSKSGSLMTCVRQRMTESICQTLPSLLGKEYELLFRQNGGYFMIYLPCELLKKQHE